ncbi:ribonuclease H-like domain-containing protein [Bacillus altitudinis]|uniref:ribonuclease H-like domain-containing protein n=1 Tax=Bacillus altitudinis TaxID=293387 RepID=UPI00227FAB69|nr:ribonuclease H-like domain-containing protein [Bacillus altitudinis]MCY7689365.1 ribonuclease H-like domain-containing protein [Bacillus altitudinis]
MSLKGKLNRMKKHLSHNQSDEKRGAVKEGQTHTVTAETIPFLKEWGELGAAPYYFEDSFCLIREVTYPLDHQHGRYSFAELPEMVSAWNKSEIQHSLSAKGYKPHELFFFDTETTGLSGGTGNMIFLLGHARVYSDKVVVKQHLLTNPGNEAALYNSFLSEVDVESLVTYNGKSFDWPQVKTRHTLLRDQIPALPEFGHFDLLHGSRRLWKHKYERMALSVVEKEELHVNREGDTPGFLAPMIYFHFLKEQNPKLIEGILTHNELDVLSLISLYIHLSKKILSKDAVKEDDEKYALAKWHLAHRDVQEATKHLQELTGAAFEHADQAAYDLSLQYKRLKQWDEAACIWRRLFESSDVHLRLKAGVELAKYEEHRQKDPKAALSITQTLLSRSSLSERDIVELDKREKRLLRKAGQ